MKKGKQAKRVLASATVATLVMSTVMAVPAQAAKRYEGKGRVQTALSVSKEWTKSDVAIIAPADDANLVDALAVSPLAKSCDAPILLNFKGDTLDNDVKAELNRLGVKKVYIATGNGILTQKFEDAVKKEVKDVARLGGKDKFATSLNIAKELNSKNKVKDVCIVNGLADALAVASFAGQKNMPILLTNGKELTADVKAFLNEVKPENTFVIGGTGVISEDLCKEVKGKRLAGADRFATNRAILNNFVAEGTTFDTVFVASGSDAHLVDALAGSALAAKQGAPVVLAGETLSSEQAKEIKNLLKEGKEATILGGEGAVSDSIKADIVKIEKGETEGDFKVESVEAINAKQFQVKFSQKVDSDDAEIASHYEMEGTAATNAELEDDGRTVTVTFGEKGCKSLTDSNKEYTVKVSNVQKKDSGEVIPTFVKVIKAMDDKAPEVKEIEFKTNGSRADNMTIKFSEPVKGKITVKIDGDKQEESKIKECYFDGMKKDGEDKGIKKLELSKLDLDASKEHKVEVIGAEDFAGNAAGIITKTIKAEKDTTAPKVESVSEYVDNAVLVKFDKKMDKTTVDKDSFTIIDEKGKEIRAEKVVQPDDIDDDVEFVVVLPTDIFAKDSTKTLNITLKDTIKDDAGNKLTSSAKSVKLTEDEKDPKIEKVLAVKNSNGYLTKLVVYTNEKLAEAAKDNNKAKIVITDANGVETKDITVGNIKKVAYGDKKVEINLGSKVDKGTYKFTFNKGFVKDASSNANESEFYKCDLTVSNEEQSKKFDDGAKQDNVSIVDNSKIQIKFDSAVDKSATDWKNYSISGLKNSDDLKNANIKFTDDTQTVVEIDLTNVDVKDGKDVVFTMKNIKKINGDRIKDFTKSGLKLQENVRPTLIAAVKGEHKAAVAHVDGQVKQDHKDAIEEKQATKEIGGITFTAVKPGKAGNDITVEFKKESSGEKKVTVEVKDTNKIVITAEQNATAKEIGPAVEAKAEAKALVTSVVKTEGTAITNIGATNLAGGVDHEDEVIAKPEIKAVEGNGDLTNIILEYDKDMKIKDGSQDKALTKDNLEKLFVIKVDGTEINYETYKDSTISKYDDKKIKLTLVGTEDIHNKDITIKAKKLEGADSIIQDTAKNGQDKSEEITVK